MYKKYKCDKCSADYKIRNIGLFTVKSCVLLPLRAICNTAMQCCNIDVQVGRSKFQSL